MDFRDLTYIAAIAKYQNITKAAESLYVTQPTLSKFLMATEDALGQKLFRKLGHKYVPTYAGERYLDYAKRILNLKNDLDTEMADIMKRDVGVLNVAFPRMRCTYMLPKSLPAFKKLHPNVQVNILEGTSAENDQRLINGQADIAFFSMPSDTNPLIEYETIGEEELLICAQGGHPISHFSRPNPASRYPKLDPAILQNEMIIMMMQEQRTRGIMDDYFAKNNLHFDKIMYTSNLQAIMGLVAAGYGVSFIFETHLHYRPEKTPIDCYSFGEPKTVRRFVCAYRKGSYLPSCAGDFIDIAREIFKIV
ncbi:MAG: LysR family transcriptional regulator [Lachnospiraceae bacterium]|nr:LysR family transcriptional regulator [Lachnospiraceae bacterium]